MGNYFGVFPIPIDFQDARPIILRLPLQLEGSETKEDPDDGKRRPQERIPRLRTSQP